MLQNSYIYIPTPTYVCIFTSNFYHYLSIYLVFCHATSFTKFSNHLIIELWRPVCAVSVAH